MADFFHWKGKKHFVAVAFSTANSTQPVHVIQMTRHASSVRAKY